MLLLWYEYLWLCVFFMRQFNGQRISNFPSRKTAFQQVETFAFCSARFLFAYCFLSE